MITRPPTTRSVVLDSADLRVVSSSTNQNREAKGPGVLRMSPGSPLAKKLSLEMSLAIGTIVRFNNRWRVTMICIAALLPGWPFPRIWILRKSRGGAMHP
jgi:hypothetical protein